MWIHFLMSIFPLSIRKSQESLNLDFSDNHVSLYSLNLFSKISFVGTFNSESCMVPAGAEWRITCYRKRPFHCSWSVLTVQRVDFFFLLPAVLFFLLHTGLWSSVIMYESVISRNTHRIEGFSEVSKWKGTGIQKWGMALRASCILKRDHDFLPVKSRYS